MLTHAFVAADLKIRLRWWYSDILIGLDCDRLEQEVDLIMTGKSKKGENLFLLDGKASERIAGFMTKDLKS